MVITWSLLERRAHKQHERHNTKEHCDEHESDALNRTVPQRASAQRKTHPEALSAPVK